MKTRLISRSFHLFLAAVFLLLTAGQVLAAQGSVAITQFKLNGPPATAYLKQGMRDMLGGRLTTEAGVTVLPGKAVDALIAEAGPELSPEKAAKIAAALKADYLIFGSLTALGGGLSVDARVFSVSPDSPELQIQPFYGTAASQGEMMRAIDKVSWDVLETIFGKKRPASVLPQAIAGTPVPSPFMTTHPDKTFMTSGGGYTSMGGRAFTKTRNMKMSLQSVAVGDVDGDGNYDVIIADKSTITVYQRSGTRLNKIASVEMLARYGVHSVTVADLDLNGRAEIYISAADYKIPGSRIMEWDGKQLVSLVDQARWYIRPVEVPGMGLVLAGQRAGFNASISMGVYRLMRNGDTLMPEQRLALPADVNLFNFEYADLDGDGKSEVVAVDDYFKLRVYDLGGNMKYKSSDRFCGTNRYIGGKPDMMPTSNPRTDDEADGIGEKFPEIPVPSPILITDIDSDGLDDVVVNRNPSTMAAAMPRLAQFTHGTMVGLKWNGIAMEELWRTRRIDGYVVDYQEKSRYARLKQGVQDELFLGVILRSSIMDAMFTDESTVIIYPFEFQQEADAAR